MDIGVVLLGFGEPENPTESNVREYLKRIFLSNMDLEGEMSMKEAEERALELAERRMPGLMEEYNEIGGGSPLIPQSKEQALLLEDELASRDINTDVYLGMQYTDPLIEDIARDVVSSGHDALIGIPLYPLCGRTTTIESLMQFRESVQEIDVGMDIYEIGGWHRHPDYIDMRAGNISGFIDDEIPWSRGDFEFVFSAHGTPMKYIDQGSRYVEYVEENCNAIADKVGIDDFYIGYQNHANRGVPWTEPDIEEVVEDLDGDHIVVEPISFIHEQSETLHELDIDLKEDALEEGIEQMRVPVPYKDDSLISVLADIVEYSAGLNEYRFIDTGCRCVDSEGAICTNT